MAKAPTHRQKRRLGPPPAPRHRLPLRQRGFWAGAAVGVVVSVLLVTGTILHRSSGHVIWGPGRAQLRERLRTLGLPALPVQGTKLHIHQHLDVFVDGKRVTVPAGIGIGTNFFSPVHTHDTSGIVHIESPVVHAYTLGEFFGVWGVRLTATCLGGYCNAGARGLATFVDGKRFSGDPAQIDLRPHTEILIAFGTRAELPKSIPSSYSFPSGD